MAKTFRPTRKPFTHNGDEYLVELDAHGAVYVIHKLVPVRAMQPHTRKLRLRYERFDAVRDAYNAAKSMEQNS